MSCAFLGQVTAHTNQKLWPSTIGCSHDQCLLPPRRGWWLFSFPYHHVAGCVPADCCFSYCVWVCSLPTVCGYLAYCVWAYHLLCVGEKGGNFGTRPPSPLPTSGVCSVQHWLVAWMVPLATSSPGCNLCCTPAHCSNVDIWRCP